MGRPAWLMLVMLGLLGLITLSACGYQKADMQAEPARSSKPDLSITEADAGVVDVEAREETILGFNIRGWT